jgi:glycosyltransferase involved in cell wall biosynthesis
VALHPPDGPATYPAEVQHRIRRDEPEDYALAAESLNGSSVDVVSLQFEPGIWGGKDGESILTLIGALEVPAVTTLHTVPRRPTPGQLNVIQQIVEVSAAVVVHSPEAATLLARTYGARPGKVEVVPHGVPNLPLVDPETVKPRLGLEGRHLLLSFGLMDPGKGYEAAIEAMRAVVDADATALYVILGATHIDLLGTEGEAYRERLVSMVGKLGLGDHVRFENRFVGRVELARWVEAADVVVAPYVDPDRMASGTIAYAMSAGRAVIAAPSTYAKTRLSRGRGVVLADRSPEAIAAAVLRLLDNPRVREGYGRKAWEATRGEIWSEAGAAYSRIFAKVTRPNADATTSLQRLTPVAR